MRLYRGRLICGLLAVCLTACGEVESPPVVSEPPAAAALAGIETPSQQGGFRLRVVDAPQPIPQNVLLGLSFKLTDSAGQPVAGARFGAVNGSMPAHGHGFLTAPQVTERGGGDYRIEGLKFHMAGEWELSLVFEAGGKQDSAVLKFTLP